MLLRPAIEQDLAQIVAIERLPETRQYVGQWSEERHARAMAGKDARYLVSDGADGGLQAYAILRGFEDASGSIELKRIAVAAPGQGVGRRILAEVLRMVFEEWGAHRLFLDVYEDNLRARHLYEAAGFVREGILRDAGKREGRYFPLHLMSILEDEYRRRPAAHPGELPAL